MFIFTLFQTRRKHSGTIVEQLFSTRGNKTSIAMESASSSPAVQHKSVEWKSVNEGITRARLYTRHANVTTVQVYALYITHVIQPDRTLSMQL